MRIRTIAIAGLAGAAVAYLFDPIAGSMRRSRLRERIAAYTRRRTMPVGKLPPLPVNMIPTPEAEISEMTAEPAKQDAPDLLEAPPKEEVSGKAEEPRKEHVAGTPQERPLEDIAYMPQERLRGYLADAREGRPMEDGAIAGRIRMKVLERPDLETGSLLIDVVQGVAFLRGELKDRKEIEEIVDLAGSVPGVRGVQNLIVIRLPESQAVSRPAGRPLGDAWSG
jgi:hypothetical protein